MRSTEPRYAPNRISKEERTRLQIAGGLCALGGMLAVTRLFQLQVVQGKELRTLAEQRRMRRRPLLARRGAILDRWNRTLVHTLYKYHLALDPQSVRNPEALYEMVHTYLKMNPEPLAQAIREARAQGRRYLRFAIAVPPHLAEPFLKAYRALPFRDKPAIINKEVIPAREYPFSRLAPQVLGVVQLEEDPAWFLSAASRRASTIICKASTESKRARGLLAGSSSQRPSRIGLHNATASPYA